MLLKYSCVGIAVMSVNRKYTRGMTRQEYLEKNRKYRMRLRGFVLRI